MAASINDERTSVSLLGSVKSTSDQAGWVRFVATYEPLMARWLRQRGLAEHIIPDVIGEVYLKLVAQMPTFVYDECRTFRGWLKTVAENAANDFLKKAYRRYENSVDFGHHEIALRCSSVFDRKASETLDAFVEDFELRVRNANEAVRRVRERINPKTWQAFYLTEVEENSCEDAALKLNMTPNSVYVARFRVRNYLRVEGAKINQIVAKL